MRANDCITINCKTCTCITIYGSNEGYKYIQSFLSFVDYKVDSLDLEKTVHIGGSMLHEMYALFLYVCFDKLFVTPLNQKRI